MVKRVVYPIRSSKDSPYDIPNKNETRGFSVLSKFKNFFTGSWNNKQEQKPEEENNGEQANSVSTLKPFKYPAPDASIVSNIGNISSRSTSVTSSRLGSPKSVSKRKLVKYLQDKGISELEAEGILSVAKHIEDSGDEEEEEFDDDHELAQKARNKDVVMIDDVANESMFLKNSNTSHPYLKLPGNTKKDNTDKTVDESLIANVSAAGKFRTPNNSMAIKSKSIASPSVYNLSYRNRSFKFSELSSPYRFNIPKEKKTIDVTLSRVLNDTTMNNDSFQSANSTFKREYSDVSTALKSQSDRTTRKHNADMSETAATILNILDGDDVSKQNLQPPDVSTDDIFNRKKSSDPVDDRKGKYEIFVNPYANTSLSKLKPRNDKRKSSTFVTKTTEKDYTKENKDTKETEETKDTKGSNDDVKIIDDDSHIEAPSFSVATSSTPATSITKQAPPSSILNANKYKPAKSSSLRAELASASQSSTTVKNKETESSTNTHLDSKRNIIVYDVSDNEEESDDVPMQEVSLTKVENKNRSPVMSDSFLRNFYFPKAVKQDYSIEDIDAEQVERFKKVLVFEQ